VGRSFAPPYRRPREVVVPIDLEPGDLEAGVIVRLSLRARADADDEGEGEGEFRIAS
jgi:hypothetical protein